MKILVIANPRAGKGDTERKVEEFVQVLRRRGHETDVFLSCRPEDPSQRAAKIRCNEFDRIVVAGGDGTVNAVVNGLADPSRIPLLHLATGTANILAKDLGLPSNPELLVPIIEGGDVLRADMGVLGARKFLLVAGAGFDAMVTKQLSRSRGRTLGYRGYVLPIIRALSTYRPPDLEVVVDDKHQLKGSMVMVLNSKHYGGLFVFDYDACLDSGSFQICVFPRAGIPSLAKYTILGLLRLAPRIPDILRCSGRKVVISGSTSCPVQVDGEYAGTTPVRISLCPGVIPLLTVKNVRR